MYENTFREIEGKEQNETSSNWMQVLAKSVTIAGEL